MAILFLRRTNSRQEMTANCQKPRLSQSAPVLQSVCSFRNGFIQTREPMKTLKSLLLTLGLAALPLSPAPAQPLPDDLTAVPTNVVTAQGDCYFSIAHWGVWPPLPFLPPWSGDLYYSPSMISTGNVTFY
jgi:hypothetical protein